MPSFHRATRGEQDGRHIIQEATLTSLCASIATSACRTVEYEIQIERHFVSDIDPRTGRSKQHIFNGAKPDGTITTTITVRAYDASGNLAEKSVTVNLIKK